MMCLSRTCSRHLRQWAKLSPTHLVMYQPLLLPLPELEEEERNRAEEEVQREKKLWI